jgi:prephenate dehydratase
MAASPSFHMKIYSIAHLGPSGTYTEVAALTYADTLRAVNPDKHYELHPYPTIAQTLRAVANGQADFGVVPVENSIEGSVTVTLDTLWQLDHLQVQQAVVLPIAHALLSYSSTLDLIQTVYSHPQALAQCQIWLETYLPNAQVVAISSTGEAVQRLKETPDFAAIASQRAAKLYDAPVMAYPINDYADNCTRFWAVSQEPSSVGSHASLAFSFPANRPGSLAKALQIFAERNINLSRVESRPTKRSLGDYLFFIDIEANIFDESVQLAVRELETFTETLKILGSYSILNG